MVKKIIIITAILLGQAAHAEDAYLINFGDDLWSVELLTETCPLKLRRAIDQIAEHLSTKERKIVALLPEELGYQYFSVEFKELKNGLVVNLDKPIVYKFEYWTDYDEHNRCIKVEPYNIAKKSQF